MFSFVLLDLTANNEFVTAFHTTPIASHAVIPK
jgi:hypothetical protein